MEGPRRGVDDRAARTELALVKELLACEASKALLAVAVRVALPRGVGRRVEGVAVGLHQIELDAVDAAHAERVAVSVARARARRALACHVDQVCRHVAAAVGLREVHVEHVRPQDLGFVLQPQLQDGFTRLRRDLRVDLDPDRLRLKLLHRRDQDPAVPAPEIHHRLPPLGLRHLQHPVDDLLWRWHIRRHPLPDRLGGKRHREE